MIKKTYQSSFALALLAFSCWIAPEALSATAKKKASTRKVKAGSTWASFSAAQANNLASSPVISSPKAGGSAVLRVQILLDRAHFSPGEIDGRFGRNTRLAAMEFNKARGLTGGEKVDKATWAALNRDAAAVIVPYTVTPEDVAGPFEKIPQEMADKAKLTSLGFESPLEALSEKFHSSPGVLKGLNPPVAFGKAGVEIQVPSVSRPALTKEQGSTLRVSETERAVVAMNAEGEVLARYPATVGSKHDPLPLGKWKVNGVAKNPTFNYNPELFWDAEPGDQKAKLAAGPNNPVGVVWIDLSKPHYGIHGSPEPSTVGGTTSHGCIRLTNWDAAELSGFVSPGTTVILEQ